MKKPLLMMLACLFVVMIGFGITLPVLPFYAERLALAEGASRQSVVLHVGLLTAVYSVMQLIFAPLWGHWSDRTGRRPLLLIGIAGYVSAQVLFGLATSLWLLYAARTIGGILSSATLPVAAAYVADVTADRERSRGMAWLGTTTSLGVIVGPAFGGMLARKDLHLYMRFGHFKIDSFSIPFFVAAFLGLVTLCAALRWLPESLPPRALRAANERMQTDWLTLLRDLRPLLALALTGQFALAVFEGTFALYAQKVFNYGPVGVGAVFVVCGLVMTVFQAGVSFLAGRISEIYQLAAGFGLMGVGITLLAAARTRFFVFVFVGLLAMGMAFIAPNLATLIAQGGGRQQAGTALGLQNAANSLGQAGGPLLGGALFLWMVNAPYLVSGGLLVTIALVMASRLMRRRSEVVSKSAG